jgi:hypothetical protein
MSLYGILSEENCGLSFVVNPMWEIGDFGVSFWGGQTFVYSQDQWIFHMLRVCDHLIWCRYL